MSWVILVGTCYLAGEDTTAVAIAQNNTDRSPVGLVYNEAADWLATANETSDSISLVNASTGELLDEIKCGKHPADIKLTPDGQTIVVTASHSGTVHLLGVSNDKLTQQVAIKVGYRPLGIAITSDGTRAFVGLVATGEVAEIDVRQAKLVRRIPVGKWPRYLTLSPDDRRLAVGLSGEGRIAVVDTKSGEVLYDEGLTGGINIGHMATDREGDYAYFTWMVYRSNPINTGNIRRGWVLASRIGRVRLDGASYREAISLDVGGMAIADPHGLAISPSQNRLAATASGTHELLVYRLPDLPFIGVGGPGDLIDRKLLADRDLFYRIPLGGRPMGAVFSNDDKTVLVANYLRNSVQRVDIIEKRVTAEYRLGGASEPSLARKGATIFYDGRRSLDQWYSCHTCHNNGGVNSKPMDTHNDGTELTNKTVLPLYHLNQTKPWTWHGWQTSLDDAMNKSFTSTMQGRAIGREDSAAILEYLFKLDPGPNPFRTVDGGLTAAASRGKAIFNSKAAACIDCHNGPHFTDGKIHDVGLGSERDRYDGFNTPTLTAVYQKVRFLHDGRAKTLEAVLSKYHSPADVSGERALKEDEIGDLIEYLKSL